VRRPVAEGDDRPTVEQNVTATGGFAYGVIGADIHVLGDGSPLYVLENYHGPPQADPIWLRELPSRMLNARYAVVDFTSREGECEDLRKWCRARPRLAARWLYGPGGQGKTRLAARLAQELVKAGWKVVTVAHGRDAFLPPPGSQDLRLGNAPGLLVIVDYADRWPLTHLNWLLSNALFHQGATPTRVLLLARTALAWPALRSGLENYQAGVSQQLLAGLPNEPRQREHMFTAARDSFAAVYGVDAGVIAPPSRLDHPDLGLILTLHMAALVAVDAYAHGRRLPEEMVGLTGYLLDRERHHWTLLYEHSKSLDYQTPPGVMTRVVFTAALTGPVDHPTGKTILSGPDLELHPERALTDHTACYPPTDPARRTVLEPLYPDRLAEDFLALTMGGHPDDQPAHAWAQRTAATLLARDDSHTPPDYTPRAITFLASAAQRWPHLGEFLYPLLRLDPQLTLDAGSAALIAIAAIPNADYEVLEAIERGFPIPRHVDLDVGIAAVTARLAEHLLAQANHEAQRAYIHSILGWRLANAGQSGQALASSEQAVQIYQRLAAANPAQFESDLGLALTNLGARLSDVGRREEALAATRKAVDIYRRLARLNPAVFEPDLGAALNNLTVGFLELGQWKQALTFGEEAVRIHRHLVTVNPRSEPDLARSVSNMSITLLELGHREEALASAREAVEIHRRLAAANPAAYEHDLASTLINLGGQLSRLGRSQEGLAATQEAIRILRRQAAANPAAFEDSLALALNNLSNDLAAMGRRGEALAAAGEAVGIYRRLTATNPAAYEHDLAMALTNLATRLYAMNRRQEALASAGETIQIYRRLAAANAAAFEHDLALALNNFGIWLSGMGRHEEALAVAKEATDIFRRLTTANSAAYEEDLAMALANLGNCLNRLQRYEEALASTDEAVQMYRRLAAANPAAFEHHLASSIDNQGILRSAVELQDEAVVATSEAVEIYRRLAATNPAAFDPDLAMALTNLGNRLSNSGRHEDALDPAREAVKVYRRLTAVNRAAFEDGLAACLDNLGVRLLALQHYEEAAVATGEAVEIYRRLAAANPAAFDADLAMAVNNLAIIWSEAERLEEG
jgi:hypothetical protein